MNAGGVPAPATQEMVRNVSGMTINYLAPTTGNTFVPAATISAANAWTTVTAVQVTLVMQSTFQRASANGNAPIQRTYTFTATIRNRVS